jgi:hypothetical protein
LIAFVVLFFTAPFRKSKLDGKMSVEYTTAIEVPVSKAFSYLGHSNSAADWSVFVHHITTLNTREFADGTIGCKRRCFCNADESGRKWDETILYVRKDSLRTISIEKLVDFPMEATNLQTQQVYRRITDSTCELTLRLYYVNNEFGWWDGLKTRAGSFTIESVFRKNLENIKEVLEGRTRKHAFEPSN